MSLRALQSPLGFTGFAISHLILPDGATLYARSLGVGLISDMALGAKLLR